MHACRQREVEIPFVLINTGSASTVFSSDWGTKAGIVPEADDTIRIIRGIGGNEVVFARRLSCIKIGKMVLPDFEAEFGSMDYGFQINGILGMDLLLEARAMVDLTALSIEFSG